MKKFVVCILIFTILLTGCKSNELLSAKNPVTINLWHNYGGLLKDTMDILIDEFNDTIGRENGIIINVTSKKLDHLIGLQYYSKDYFEKIKEI